MARILAGSGWYAPVAERQFAVGCLLTLRKDCAPDDLSASPFTSQAIHAPLNFSSVCCTWWVRQVRLWRRNSVRVRH